MKMLTELHYPDAEKIVIIQDNLSTHYTPKRASRLNKAEIGNGNPRTVK